MHKPLDPKLIDSGQCLLPWYVNGTLSEIENAKLNQLKSNSQDFEREVQREKQLHTKFKDKEILLSEVLDQEAIGFSKLKQKIAEDTSQSAVHFLKRAFQRINKRQRYYVFGMAASFFLCLGVSLGLVLSSNTILPSQDTDFYVLTDTAETKGAVLQLVFDRELSQEDINILLNDSDAELLNGPSTNGVYRVKVKTAEHLSHWQQHAHIRWAELEGQ